MKISKDAQIKLFEHRLRRLKSVYTQLGAILETIEAALDGQEPSDFMLSFPIVRRVYDLVLSKDKEVL